MHVDDSRTIVTPEQVPITYTIAGVGTRFAAILADSLLQAVALTIVGLAVSLLGSVLPDDLSVLDELMTGWMAAVVIIVAFGILWGYFIAFETVWNGQTPGKRWCGIRVIRDSGHPVDFRTAFVRNVCRYVDFLPGFYGVGALVMFFSKDSKRLGDFAAGTLVIVDTPVRWRTIAATTGAAPLAQEVTESAQPAVPVAAAPPVQYQLLGDPSAVNLRALTREQYTVVDHFLSRRRELTPEVAQRLARQIAEPLIALIGMAAPTAETFPYADLLAELADAYRRRHAN